MATIAPVRRAVAVAAGPERAFEVFTAEIGRWWPMATHSVFGEQASVAFEDGRLVERIGDAVSEWGEVLEWDPPRLLRLTWRPGNPAEEATEVTVRFHPDGDGTRVDYRLRLSAELPKPLGLALMPDGVVERVAERIVNWRMREIADGFVARSLAVFARERRR